MRELVLRALPAGRGGCEAGEGVRAGGTGSGLGFAGIEGVTATIIPDPTNNPLDRLMLAVDPEKARITAWELADQLAAGNPPVIVRDHEAEQGFFQLDPCNLHPGEVEVVADRVLHELGEARKRNRPQQYNPTERKARRFERLLRWPD